MHKFGANICFKYQRFGLRHYVIFLNTCVSACGSPKKIIYTCPNNKTVKSYIYEKRVNGKCEKFPLKRKHTKNCIIRYVWKLAKSKIIRKKRSIQLHTSSKELIIIITLLKFYFNK